MSVTDDAEEYGTGVWVYCRQHLRPHLTGWCTVHPADKTPLFAKTEDEAYAECRELGLKLYEAATPDPYKSTNYIEGVLYKVDSGVVDCIRRTTRMQLGQVLFTDTLGWVFRPAKDVDLTGAELLSIHDLVYVMRLRTELGA